MDLSLSSTLVREIELFENERYQLSIMDWSENGLLPTDRKGFSTKDGKHGWNSIDQAGEVLISRGWSWLEPSWSIDNDYPNTDSDGWSYANNFSSIEISGSAIKGISHFVRRRRRTRKQTFIASSTIEGTCDHCDSEYTNVLSDKLLEALTTSSLHENPGEFPSHSVTNRLKDLLMETMGLASISETMDLNEVNVRLDKFLIQVLNKKSAWSQAISIFSGEYSPELLPKRALDLDRFIFPADERTLLAKILIRKYDSQFEFHCNSKNCGANCIYAPFYCGNDGCTTVLSLKWKSQHDSVCPFKVVECPRQCGEVCCRRSVQTHMEETCELRPAECPFKSMGCAVENLTIQELTQHLDSSTQAHLMLVTKRVTEQQSVILLQLQRIKELEDKTGTIAQTLTGLEASSGSAKAALSALQRDIGTNDAHWKEMERMEKKIDKEVSSIATEMATTRKSIRTVERASAVNKSRIEALEAKGGDDK